MAAVQSTSLRLTRRHRQQAGSYKFRIALNLQK